MSTSQMMLGGAGEPYTLEHAGKSYRFGRLTRARMNTFTVQLIDRRRSRLAVIYDHDQEELSRRLAKLGDEALAGVYDFLEPAVLQGTLQTRDGQVMLLSILCDCTWDEAFDLITQRKVETEHLLDLVVAESLGKSKDRPAEGKPAAEAAPVETADPNAAGPA